MHVTIYHNPRCSKSRETLALIEDQGITPHVIRYLETPPDAATLHTLVKKLPNSAGSIRELLRRNEAAYKDLSLDNEALSGEQLIAAVVAHPELLQRPIVVVGNQARIGRPPENVLEILPTS